MQKLLTAVCLFLTLSAFAQHKSSIDLAAIRNFRTHHNGLNVSFFYHFNEHLTAGAEMNRFFPVTKKVGTEELKESAWDFDYNMHYILPIHKSLKYYPILGFSHTSEKESLTESGETSYARFWSANTGLGLLLETGKVSPHIEYLATWGKHNQQFILAGLSFEMEW